MSVGAARAVPFYLLAALCVTAQTGVNRGQATKASLPEALPRMWEDAAVATLELPLADPVGSPKHVSSDYYYKIPVRPIYKSYPIYAPGHEPPGYLDGLKQQEPQIIWDDAGHRPPLETHTDWIRAGELVFDSPFRYDTTISVSEVREPVWWAKTGAQAARDGTLPGWRYTIRKKGQVEVGNVSCAACHDRLMPDGRVIKGAQGNFPFDRARAFLSRNRATPQFARLFESSLFATPWLKSDPQGWLSRASIDEIASVHEAIPPGVLARHRSSLFYPVQVPDLVGVKYRHYLDRTGLQQQRSLVDLMRYAALNQAADDLATYDGFLPAAIPDFTTLPDPADPVRIGGRYSDEQLYALARYVYSLEPPPNPNKFDAVAAHGQRVFEREGCPMCHTPPLYTNNKLTLAEGFTPPPGAEKKYDILPISVGTDPNLALKTRRGTGYYKVPTLKGVWYRGMFGHSGWCATLEDWFDPHRTRDDYVPTGFKPCGAKTYAVKGHPFGLDLSAEDRKALIAFLKTL
jgi:mono/diheme cytochrome c family protein